MYVFYIYFTIFDIRLCGHHVRILHIFHYFSYTAMRTLHVFYIYFTIFHIRLCEHYARILYIHVFHYFEHHVRILYIFHYFLYTAMRKPCTYSIYISTSDLLIYIISNNDEHEFSCRPILIRIRRWNDVINNVDCQKL